MPAPLVPHNARVPTEGQLCVKLLSKLINACGYLVDRPTFLQALSCASLGSLSFHFVVTEPTKSLKGSTFPVVIC